jgi:hypothetical protein
MSPDIQPPKGPESYAWLTYLWVLGLSSLGGFVAFVRKVKEGNARAWNFAEFLGEIATSAFAGMLTFFLCESSNINPLMTAAFVGITGHMGSRALFYLESFFSAKFPAPMPVKDENDVPKS